MGGSKQTQTTSQTTNPYAPAQPLVNDIIGKAQNLGNQANLFTPSVSNTTMQGIQGLETLAGGPNAQQSYISSLLPQLQSGFGSAMGVLQKTAGGGFLAGNGGSGGGVSMTSGPTPVQAPGGPVSMTSGPTPTQAMGDVSMPGGGGPATLPGAPQQAGGGQPQQAQGGSNNPYLDSVLNTANRRAADAVNAQFSGAGRFGSGAHTGILADRLGGIETQARFDDYNNERTRQLQAAGLLQGAGMQGAGLAGQLDTAGVNQAGLMLQAGGLRDQIANAQKQAPLAATQWQAGLGFPAAQLGGTKEGTSTSYTPPNYLGMGISGLTTAAGLMTGNPMMALGGLGGLGGQVMNQPGSMANGGWSTTANKAPSSFFGNWFGGS